MKKTIIFKENDQFTIKADFYETNRSYAPAIIYIHGGGLLWGDREDLSEEMIQLYTNNGFALFSIDYRLAPRSTLSDILEDVQDSLLWLVNDGPEQFSIDPSRIAVVGSSAGGFLALCTGMFTHKPRAIVSFYGYGDISAQWALEPSKFYCEKDIVSMEIAKSTVSDQIITNATVDERFLLYLYARQSGHWIQEVTGLNPSLHKEELLKFCPIYHVTKDFPPTLLLHGTNDVDVPYEQSAFMRAALVKEGVPAKLITIPNGEHVFEKDFANPVVQKALHQVIDFLQLHLAE
jgi:acetyl esterase/lipase